LPNATLNWYRAVDDDLYVPAGEVRVPTLYIWGENDMALGEDAAMRTKDFVKAPYQFVRLPDMRTGFLMKASQICSP
jgi:pimeloyl-ACP methyl ester carboxylesterase